MDYLTDLRDRIQGIDRLSLLALVVAVVMGLANVLVVWKFIFPAWQEGRELTSQLASEQQALDEALRAQAASPEEWRKQLEAAQARLDSVVSVFLSDSQADEVSHKLYQYAVESEVEIASLQTQSVAQEEEKDTYDVKRSRLQANGTVPNLVDFVSRIEEAALESFVISDVNITESEEQHALNMDITLYTSPLSSGATVLPAPGVTVTPEGLVELEAMLETAWAAEEWEQVIGLIEQILTIDSDYPDMPEKLYSAHVNYGRQLVEEGRLEEAKAEFYSALDIKGDGVEALAELEQAAAWELTPTVAPTDTPALTPGATPPGTPAPTPTLTLEGQLEQSLHESWKDEDWEEVIGLIEQILAINPHYDDMTEKLYAAHVNYGRQLAAEGKLEEAKVEFTRALDVNPDGGEAIAELQALSAGETPAPPATPTPESQPTIHVVRSGDTLYSIANRYGATVQAIMAANGLTNYNIHVGQELRIPIY